MLLMFGSNDSCEQFYLWHSHHTTLSMYIDTLFWHFCVRERKSIDFDSWVKIAKGNIKKWANYRLRLLGIWTEMQWMKRDRIPTKSVKNAQQFASRSNLDILALKNYLLNFIHFFLCLLTSLIKVPPASYFLMQCS